MPDKPYDLALLGATGTTGRQAVRALRRQAAAQGLRVLLAGRRPEALQALAGEGTTAWDTLRVDLHDEATLQALADRSRVVLNLAGPYAEAGEGLVAAAIERGCHVLDITGETFWVRHLVARRHAAAVRAGVMIVPSCGYEVLPFELAVHEAARRLARRDGEACQTVKLLVRFTGQRLARLQDVLGPGTLGSLRSLLRHDHGDSTRNAACLLDPADPLAETVRRRHPPRWTPRFDEEVNAVVAPMWPAPWVTPPMVLRGVALGRDGAEAPRFAPDFQYAEGTDLHGLLPELERDGWPARWAQGLAAWWPGQGAPAAEGEGPAAAWRRALESGREGASLAAQWAAAAALSAPLAGVAAAMATSATLPREALERLVAALTPAPGSGPSEALLDGVGYEIAILARGDAGGRCAGRLVAHGHPAWRSTAEMAVAAAVGLSRGTLGRGGPGGVRTPASAFGAGLADAMRPAGVSLHWDDVVS